MTHFDMLISVNRGVLLENSIHDNNGIKRLSPSNLMTDSGMLIIYSLHLKSEYIKPRFRSDICYLL